MSENEKIVNEVIETPKQSMIMSSLSDAGAETYCSLPSTTRDEKLDIFALTQNPDKQISDCVNVKINLVDVFAENVTLEDGSVCPRILLIDDKGKSYQCVSFGMFNNIKKLFALIGEPHYEEPVPIIVRTVQTKKGSTYSLDIAKK